MSRLTVRWPLLLIFSYLIAFFIHPTTPFILQYITLTSYVFGYFVTKKNRTTLWIGILLLLLPLFLIRTPYLSFIPRFSLIATLGLSFYTLKAISYLIDIYRSKIRVENNYGVYSLFIAFFPQLLSGPIDRPENILPQLKNPNPLSTKRTYEGSVRILWGLFEKLVVANSLALIVNEVYMDPKIYIGLPLLLVIFLYAIQIYADFSGYSHMAIGAARILGIDSIENFHKPYHARSIQEFWRRWHISLSTWLRDYIYIPLGGNKVSFNHQMLNIVVTFFLSGLWHGTGLTFVIWGLLHGAGIVGHHVRELFGAEMHKDRDWAYLIMKTKRLSTFVTIPTTFFLVSLLWVLFRANNLSDALYILTHFYSGIKTEIVFLLSGGFSQLWSLLYNPGYKLEEYIFISILLVLPLYGLLSHLMKDVQTKYLSNHPVLIRWSIYYSVIFSILFFLYIFEQSKVTFIYSRF